MNFNEEMEKELNELNLGGKCTPISDEDKGTLQDYLNIEEKLLLTDMETTRMVRESSKNARLGLPCGNSLVEQAVKMRQELTDSYCGLDELLRLFIKTSCSDNFIKDNVSKCDTGSVQTGLIKKKGLKKL